jgi:site-specific DNA-methyltransferase (adenine-specific)
LPIDSKNKLFFGDNLRILREHVADESVDLIYLDPPFNSNANYNVLFQEKGGEQSAAQITAFEDTWHWTQEAEATYHETLTNAPDRVVRIMTALRGFLGTSDMMAYLTMMTPRLVELHRVLKETGSIYLHCDPTASHYLKIILDSIFDPQNFRNEIVWKRSDAHSDAKQGARHYGRIHDTLLFYSKSDEPLFNTQYNPLPQSTIDNWYRNIEPETGRRYNKADVTGPGGAAKGNPHYEWRGVTRYWRYSKERMKLLEMEGRLVYSKSGMPYQKRYLDESKGVSIQDWWDDISMLRGIQSKERLGYPTQKPEALLERIIQASSNEGDVVLDPFCGCGTSINVAERLHRRWLGIDITHLAISLIRSRLQESFPGALAPYEVIGDPKDVASAEALANKDLDGRYQFQWWAVGLVGGRPAQDKKKGKDTGIDGYIYFFDDNSGKAKRIILQVKSGNVKSGDIRDLKGVIEREQAQLGAFITLKPATRDMQKEAVAAGFYESQFGNFPKLQILTIEELLDGQKLLYPHMNVATFKRAERQTKTQQHGLFQPPPAAKQTPLPGTDFSVTPLLDDIVEDEQ